MGLPGTVVAGIVLLVAIVAAAAIGIAAFSEDTTAAVPLIISIIGIVGSAVPALVAALRSEQLHRDVKNGALANRNVKPAVKEAIDEDLTPLIHRLQQRLEE